ncbi:Ku protein [Streptomyces wedmorensis]|uniref:Ku protein n=1 Tax=Streptomyces wedmorensis TaxID=43759 RepID=UPI00343B2097
MLLRQALDHTEKVAVAKYALRSRARLGLLRPLGDALVLQLLIFARLTLPRSGGREPDNRGQLHRADRNCRTYGEDMASRRVSRCTRCGAVLPDRKRRGSQVCADCRTLTGRRMKALRAALAEYDGLIAHAGVLTAAQAKRRDTLVRRLCELTGTDSPGRARRRARLLVDSDPRAPHPGLSGTSGGRSTPAPFDAPRVTRVIASAVESGRRRR